jgi:hypothetical protein
MAGTAIFRGLVRTAAILCLMLALLSVGAGYTEYLRHASPAAFRYLATEVLPLVAIAAMSVATLDARPASARWLGLLATEVSIGLLAYAMPSLRNGAPPFALMLAGVAVLLAIGTLGMALSRLTAEG